MLGNAGHTVQVGHCHFDCQVAHIRGFLGNHHVNRTITQHIDGILGRIEGHHLDLAAQALVLHHSSGSLGTEHICPKDTSQIRILLQFSLHLSLGLGRIISVVVHAHHVYVWILGLQDVLAALLACIG